MAIFQNLEKKFGNRKDCFCAFCKTPRVVYVKKRINLFNIIAAAFGSIILMFVLFQNFDPRVTLIFVGFLALAEMFVQIRWRLNIVCQECGFDPALYIREPNKAVEKVKLHLEKRAQDPQNLLRPRLKLPVLSKPSEKEKQGVKGSRISKQV